MCWRRQVRRHVTYVALFSVLYNIPRFFEYEKIEVCVGVDETREAFEMSAFGGNTVYRVVYANVLYFDAHARESEVCRRPLPSRRTEPAIAERCSTFEMFVVNDRPVLRSCGLTQAVVVR